MRHVTLTCKNHPDLRWSCKSIAFKPGYGYNGARNIFFCGFYDPNGFCGASMQHPLSGTWAVECSCSARDLILAPEDPDYGQDTIDDDKK